jgi:hypothetical protein
MTLTELQTGFRDWLADSATNPLPMGERRGLNVYQNNYRSQLVGCLQESYPQLRSWLGDEAFLYAARTHIERYPPTGWTLDAYGADFGLTLLALFPDNPDLHELAWIEAALSRAFVAQDAAPVVASGLPPIDWDAARLGFTPSLSLAPLSTNADDIWWAMHDQADRPESRMLARPGGVMAWRRAYVSCLRTLDPLEFAALAHARADGNFASLCEMLVARLGESEGVAKAGSLLAEWIASELITSIDDQEADQHA